MSHVHHSGTRKDCSWTCRQGREEDMTQEREKEREKERREGSNREGRQGGRGGREGERGGKVVWGGGVQEGNVEEREA